MSNDTCILTTKDYTILEILLDRLGATGHPMATTVRRKLDTASVVLRDSLPPDVASLSSRVAFRILDVGLDMRVLTHQPSRSPVGLFLPITAPRGLALLGLREGQEIDIDAPGQRAERLVLDKVHYQPEAVRAETSPSVRSATPATRRAALRVIAGSRAAVMPDPGTGWDDPGPSAA